MRLKPFLESKKNATYFAAILSLLTLSFFGIFAIKPTLSTAVGLIKEIQDLKELNSKYEDKITSIVRAQSEYEKIRDDIPLFIETLPFTPDFTRLIKSQEALSTSSSISMDKLTLDGMPISQTKITGKLTTFNFSLSLNGDYNNFYSYISHFLKAQRLSSIDDIDLNQEQATTGGKLSVVVKAKSYYEQ